MAAASDFNRKMLLLATQLANEFDMKKVLLSVLEALLHTVQSSDGNDLGHDTVTLIRCIIRLVLKLMAEPGADRYVPRRPGDMIIGSRNLTRSARSLCRF